MQVLDKEPTIKVEGLSKKYDCHTAVDNISFEVKKGETLAILGPNGAGKTTTVEMLEGYRKPSSGSIQVLGSEPSNADRLWQSKVGMVLQSTSLDLDLTVKETLSMFSSFYADPRHVNEVLDLVGLKPSAHKRVGHLSGGQQRRVDLALGIIGRPELLFLDEPTTGFDPVARRDAWNLVQSLCQEGMTVILTTHYMDEAKYLADRIMILVGGRIVADAPPDEIGADSFNRSLIVFKIGSLNILETLPRQIRNKLTLSGNSVSLLTDHVQQIVEQLMEWARQYKVELANLSITRPSLEEVYLELVRTEKGAMA